VIVFLPMYAIGDKKIHVIRIITDTKEISSLRFIN
jgi:hypothetical protein